MMKVKVMMTQNEAEELQGTGSSSSDDGMNVLRRFITFFISDGFLG
jgi:hypothetical protein